MSKSAPYSRLRIGSYALALLVLSPIAAVPVTLVLMFILGDSVFQASDGAAATLSLRSELAIRHTGATIFIALLFIAERALIVLPVFIAASVACVNLTLNGERKWRALGVIVLTFGALYPAVLIVGQFFDWDNSLFN